VCVVNVLVLLSLKCDEEIVAGDDDRRYLTVVLG
jgi:hypothetical protein